MLIALLLFGLGLLFVPPSVWPSLGFLVISILIAILAFVCLSLAAYWAMGFLHWVLVAFPSLPSLFWFSVIGVWMVFRVHAML
jgi:hypothetical protein